MNSIITQYLIDFSSKNIAIIGDLMLDKYIFGDVERISPEGPIPIIAVTKVKHVPGGAANVATNITTLNGNAYLLGVVGDDVSKEILINETKKFNIDASGIIIDKTKITIKKVRVISQNQQLLRIDHEDTKYIDSYTNGQFIKSLERFNEVSVIIISDYAKGTITEEFMRNIKSYATKNNIKIIVDPKPIHYSFYKDVFLITPNKKEAEEMSGIKIFDNKTLEICGRKLMNQLNCRVIITLGEKGMSIFEPDEKPTHISTTAKEVYDVSGAGDTVVAALSLAISAGSTLHEAAIIANHAAGIKVGKVGTAPVFLEELKKSFNS
jgi:D-glycero-beta-D-manno-heptose-7-phosphate kinase